MHVHVQVRDRFWRHGGGYRHWPHELFTDITQRHHSTVVVFRKLIPHLQNGAAILYNLDLRPISTAVVPAMILVMQWFFQTV